MIKVHRSIFHFPRPHWAKSYIVRDNGIASILAQPGGGALFENAVFNQLAERGSQYELDFVLTQADEPPVGLEVKYHPLLTDAQKLQRIAQKENLTGSWLVGRYPAPGFKDFVWGGLIF